MLAAQRADLLCVFEGCLLLRSAGVGDADIEHTGIHFAQRHADGDPRHCRSGCWKGMMPLSGQAKEK